MVTSDSEQPDDIYEIAPLNNSVVPNPIEFDIIKDDFTPTPSDNDSVVTLSPCHEILLENTQIIHQPLLPTKIANVVSSVSMASRVSLRFASLVVDGIFESMKFSTAATLGVTRRALVAAISSARSLHLMALGDSDKSNDALSFFKVLDYYTSAGVYVIHTTFSLAELLCLSSFHLYSATIKFSLEMAEESVHIFDGLFGETETSRALAAFIWLFQDELRGQDDALGLSKRFGRIYALGQMTKAMTAYCCLQYMNRRRWKSLVKLHRIFQGQVQKNQGGYDPSAVVKTKDMFCTAEPSPALPKILRRKSLEMFGNPHPKPTNKFSKSTENLFTAQDDSFLSLPNERRRCYSNPYLSTQSVNDQVNLSSSSIPRTLFSTRSLPSPMSPLETGYTINNVNLVRTITPKEHVRLGSRYVKFAVAAYGTNFLKIMGIEKPKTSKVATEVEHDNHNHHSLANHSDIPVEHIITSSYRAPNTLHAPKMIAPVHYVVVDQATSSVIVVLRGTLNLSDMATDLTATYDHYTYNDEIDGYVHAGILKSAMKISDSPIRATVADALNQNPTYSVVLTGHSLGAACAALLAMLWSCKVDHADGSYSFMTDTTKGFPQRSIHCYTYACPATMSADLSRYFKSMITTFIYRHDIVPCLSLGLIRDFRNITISLCHEEGMAEGVIGKVLGVFSEHQKPKQSGVHLSEPHEDLWYWALMKTLRADMKADKLYPPGTVYWINADHESVNADMQPENSKTSMLNLYEVDDVEIAFSEIVFSTSMFTDHSPHHYEGSLELLVENL
ncbi:hypothetical protein BC833DRAFT_585794 [Globomyces pollinis-pini]|nr:hypothetical protein BC833DRAFT_585794 [Globomyces pollinis-pini]